MFRKLRLTLEQVFGLSLIGRLLDLDLLLNLVLKGSQHTILQSSERYRDLVIREIEEQVSAH